MSVGHYENFPVASLLLPRRLRPSVGAIYRFARTADDFADEGQLPAAERLARLEDKLPASELTTLRADIDALEAKLVQPRTR